MVIYNHPWYKTVITLQKNFVSFWFQKKYLCKFRSIGFIEFHLLSQNWDSFLFLSWHLRQSITRHGSKLLRRWTPLDLTDSWPLIRLRISLSSDFSINYPGIDINLVINFILRHTKWFISNNRNGSLIWSSWALRKLCRKSFLGSICLSCHLINSLDKQFLSCYFMNPAKTVSKLSTTCSKWRHHEPSPLIISSSTDCSCSETSHADLSKMWETFIHARSVFLLFKY